MNVGINATLVPGSGQGGIETAVTYLIRALGALQDGDETYTLIAHPDHPGWLDGVAAPNMKIVTAPPRRPIQPKPLGPIRPLAHRMRARFVRTMWRDPWLQIPRSNGFYESLSCDVVHFPFQVYTRCDIPTIFSPHDLQHLHFRKFFTPEHFAWRQATYGAAFSEAKVIVGSGWVKNDIVKHFEVPPDRIQVIPWAAPEIPGPPRSEEVEAVRRHHGLNERFCLYPAMTWPHKNHLRLLQALKDLRDRDGLTVHLVCTGHQNEHWPTIERTIAELDLTAQVRFLGLVPLQDLRCLYRAAEFVVVPTLFEAASGPVFEAWAEDTPVACAAVTSLPEQVGDAGLLFDPYSVDAIRDAVRRMHTDDDLRKSLAEAGRRRLADFSWDRTAKAYRAVYRQEAGRDLSEEETRLLSQDWMAASVDVIGGQQ